MALDYFTNGGIADSAQEVAMAPDIKHLAQKGNQTVAMGNILEWVPVRAFSNKWTSTAYVAFITPSLIMMKGSFTSTANSNSDTLGALPEGYNGVIRCPTTTGITDNSVSQLFSTNNQGAYGIFGIDVPAATGNVVSVDNVIYAVAADQTPNAYQSGYTYITGEKCVSVGITYASLQDGNIGHTPASSPTYWAVVS